MRRWWSLAFLLILVSTASADVKLSAEVDRTRIAISEQITLTVTILGEYAGGNTPELPALPDFVAVSTGSRQNLVIENGRMSQSMAYTYTLMPRRTGRLTIGPVTLDLPSGKIGTEPIAVDVVQDAVSRPSGNQAARNGRRAKTEPFFVEAKVDHDTVYLGQQVTYTFSYYRSAVLSESNNFTPPQTTGFISVDLPPQRKRQVAVGGEPYSVVQVLTAMFPTRTGDLLIGPAKLRVVPDVFSNLLGGDPFNLLRNPGRSPLTSGEPRNLATEAINVVVRPLPNLPKGKVFSGAVGTCQLGASISDDSVGVGDPVTVTWTLSGAGRKDLVDAPRVTWPDGLEVFPPTTELKTSTTNDVVSETKTFSIAIVPRRQGAIQIPAPEITYFDPARGEYATTRGRPLALKVGPPRAGVTAAVPTQTISAAASTIRYLKSEPSEWRRRAGSNAGLLFILAQLVPPVVVVLLFVWRRRSLAPAQRARGARQKEIRAARKRVAAAARIQDPRRLAEEVATAFRSYLVARFDLPPGDLLGREWVEKLRSRRCAADDVQAALGILQSADRARFGGGVQGSHMATEAILTLMDRLDKCAG